MKPENSQPLEARGKFLSTILFGSRWLQVPLYLGLIIAQVVYVIHFMVELEHLVTGTFKLSEEAIMLIVLGLIDVVMISNLLIMVIVGGSGNNWGAVLGGLWLGWLWLAVEYLGPNLMGYVTAALPPGDLKTHLIDSAQHMRLVTLGIVLLLVLRFAPRGLIPEK
jgi:hypothetical protein